MSETNRSEQFEGWAILELFGHAKTAGYVKTVELAGHGMLRVEVPRKGDDGERVTDRTEYYSHGALYSLKPVSEELAVLTASRIGQPVTQYGLESVFAGMTVAELEHFNERLSKMVKNRQLNPAPEEDDEPDEDQGDSEYEDGAPF